jgi:hypothetical protein
LSQIKLTAENTPPARMKRAVRGEKKRSEKSAMIKERTAISSGILLKIFSSSIVLFVIIN